MMHRRQLLLGSMAATALACGPPLRRAPPGGSSGKGSAGAMHTLDDRIAGRPRTAQLYLPSGWTPSATTPLLIASHGGGSDSHTMFSKRGWRAACEDNGWIGLFPNSNLADRTESEDSAYFDHLLQRVSGEQAVDRTRVWGVGFSGGGYRMYRFACSHSWLQAIGAVGSAIHRQASTDDPSRVDASRVDVLHIHGKVDTSIPYRGGPFTDPTGRAGQIMAVPDALQRWATHLGASQVPKAGLPAECPASAGLLTRRWEADDGVGVQLVTVPALGHEWPGWATDALTAFFSAHRG